MKLEKSERSGRTNELGKEKFNQDDEWYMHKLEFVLEIEMYEKKRNWLKDLIKRGKIKEVVITFRINKINTSCMHNNRISRVAAMLINIQMEYVICNTL